MRQAKKPKTVIVASVLTGAALMTLIFAVFGMAGYSVFSGQSGAVNSSISTGIVKVNLSGTGASQALGIGASNIAPGDTMQREVEITNAGSAAIGTVTMAVTPSNTSASIVANSASGLQLSVLTCSAAWQSTTLSDSGYSYNCSGTKSTVSGPSPIASAAGGITLPGALSQIAVGGTSDFVIEVSYPPTDGNSTASQSESFAWTFTGTQASAGAV